MLEMLMQWYRRRSSDPEAIALLVILVAGFGIIFFFSGLLAPLLVAIVLAYLLEWPTVRLQSIGCSRRWATSIVLVVFVGILLLMAFVVLPIAWQQGIYLIRDMPGMLNKLSDFAATLPRRYPALMDARRQYPPRSLTGPLPATNQPQNNTPSLPCKTTHHP
ncbi:AI-2E family transporter [Ligilactobacillus salivarius]|nr:AI-2E family transporter [Ligilactobacillus salivarius]